MATGSRERAESTPVSLIRSTFHYYTMSEKSAEWMEGYRQGRLEQAECRWTRQQKPKEWSDHDCVTHSLLVDYLDFVGYQVASDTMKSQMGDRFVEDAKQYLKGEEMHSLLQNMHIEIPTPLVRNRNIFERKKKQALRVWPKTEEQIRREEEEAKRKRREVVIGWDKEKLRVLGNRMRSTLHKHRQFNASRPEHTYRKSQPVESFSSSSSSSSTSSGEEDDVMQKDEYAEDTARLLPLSELELTTDVLPVSMERKAEEVVDDDDNYDYMEDFEEEDVPDATTPEEKAPEEKKPWKLSMPSFFSTDAFPFSSSPSSLPPLRSQSLPPLKRTTVTAPKSILKKTMPKEKEEPTSPEESDSSVKTVKNAVVEQNLVVQEDVDPPLPAIFSAHLPPLSIQKRDVSMEEESSIDDLLSDLSALEEDETKDPEDVAKKTEDVDSVSENNSSIDEVEDLESYVLSARSDFSF